MKKLTYNIYRNLFKKTITSHLGKVVETEDKIICFVDKNKVKKESGTYSFPCFRIGNNSLKEDALKLNLDKPTCYIIDGFNFDKHLIYIFGYDNCEVIIRNCNFKNVVVHINGKVTLDNVGIKSIFKNTSISADDFTDINIDSEILTINDIDHLNDKGKISLSIEKDPLKLKRFQLVNQLKKLKDKCIEENSKKVKEYKESLNNKSVQHVLKK